MAVDLSIPNTNVEIGDLLDAALRALGLDPEHSRAEARTALLDFHIRVHERLWTEQDKLRRSLLTRAWENDLRALSWPNSTPLQQPLQELVSGAIARGETEVWVPVPAWMSWCSQAQRLGDPAEVGGLTAFIPNQDDPRMQNPSFRGCLSGVDIYVGTKPQG